MRPEPAAYGGLLWSATVALAAAGLGELTLVEALLLLGIVVIVPTAVPLHPASGGRDAAIAVLAGAPVAPALLLEPGVAAAVLTLPWIAAATAGTLAAARSWLSTGPGLVRSVWVAAPAYLMVGAAWLGADRLDLELAGFAAPYVLLAAVHFHYAGFASSMLAGCIWRRRPAGDAAAAALLIGAGPPIVAIGFVWYGSLQIAGAVLLTAGLWLLAWLTIRHVAPTVGRVAGTMLVLSGLATLVPMVLAVQWAVGVNLGTPALSIPDMARFHGIANAIGFAFLGVVGWRLATGRTS